MLESNGYNYIFIIAPTRANKSSSIVNKYKILIRHFKKSNLNAFTVYSFFPLIYCLQRKYYFFIRESVSLYPFLLCISFFKFKFILEINGNPVFDSISNKHIRNFFFFLRKKIISNNQNCSVYCYSPEEAKFFDSKNTIMGYNCLDRKLIKTKLPRNKNILMLVGRNSAWHGVEKIKNLSENLKDFNFYIYGMKEPKKANKNIRFFAHQNIDEIIKKNNFGYALGSLNYSAKFGSIKSNSSLKGVLYHFLDLPFIQSFEEFGSSSEFVLNIGDIDKLNKAKLNQIRNFLEKWKNRNLSNEEIKNFNPENTIKKIINFFKK